MEVYSIRDAETMQQSVRAIAASGAGEVAFFESTPLEWNQTWSAAKKAIEKFAA